jgi:hypothetical protein
MRNLKLENLKRPQRGQVVQPTRAPRPLWTASVSATRPKESALRFRLIITLVQGISAVSPIILEAIVDATTTTKSCLPSYRMRTVDPYRDTSGVTTRNR